MQAIFWWNVFEASSSVLWYVPKQSNLRTYLVTRSLSILLLSSQIIQTYTTRNIVAFVYPYPSPKYVGYASVRLLCQNLWKPDWLEVVLLIKGSG